MTTFVNSSEAARLLGVSKPTLYAYVSRGLIGRRTAIDGRTSLYDRDQLERLAARSRRRPIAERPSIDVRVSSAITHLGEEGLSYRGHDAVELTRTSTFEQVAELLWSGSLPEQPVAWRLDRDALATCDAVIVASGTTDPITKLTLCATALAGNHENEEGEEDRAADSARRLLAVVPSVLGGPRRGTVAERLAAAWTSTRTSRPSAELVDAVSRALVLLADHELATSTLAVRVAASVRTDPMSAVTAGLATVRGRLHGAASREAVALFDEATEVGSGAAIGRRLSAGERLPGFGHSVYRHGDPRFAPLLEAVRRLDDGTGRVELVDSVVAEAGRVVGHLPNVDLAIGALVHVAGLPQDVPLFAVARIAGWTAHYVEELGARPVRYRGLATRVEG